MKKRFVLTAIILGGLIALSACTKDIDSLPKGAMLLTTESYSSSSNTKTSVQDNTVQWVSDDEVRIINSETNDRTVTVDGGKAYISTSLSGSGDMRGYYPKSIITADGAEDNVATPKVIVPDHYDCHYNAGRQIIALPMVATASAGANTIRFKHLTAAIKVILRNEMNFELTLDSVVVSSASYNLSGIVNLTLTNNNFGLSAATGSGAVTVRFTDSPTIAANGYHTVQVPILPIGESIVSIDVYSHSKVGTVMDLQGLTNANYDFHYSCSPTTNTPALGRNMMATARIALKRASNTVNPATMTETNHGLFTVNSSGKQVYFSQGNLKYSNGIWSFQTNQYDRCFTENGNTTASYSAAGTFDLFGWGTSGISGYTPMATNYFAYCTEYAASKYNPYGSQTTHLYDGGTDANKADWGYNAISNGGNAINSGWRTPKNYSNEGIDNEWYYILNSRATGNRINNTENARYTLAIINTDGTQDRGMILFPDNYTAGSPNGVTWGAINGASNWGTKCTTTGWLALEAAGCVFLPAAGYRSNTDIFHNSAYGKYWSSSYNDNSNAYYLNFLYNYSPSIPSGNKSFGYSVRLVRDAN